EELGVRWLCSLRVLGWSIHFDDTPSQANPSWDGRAGPSPVTPCTWTWPTFSLVRVVAMVFEEMIPLVLCEYHPKTVDSLDAMLLRPWAHCRRIVCAPHDGYLRPWTLQRRPRSAPLRSRKPATLLG